LKYAYKKKRHIIIPRLLNYKLFETKEISFLEQQGTISKASFQVLVIFDNRYKGKLKDINNFIEMLFQALDRDSSGALSFREFIIGKQLLESNDVKDHVRFIFNLLDISHDKLIEKKEILIFLQTVHKAGAFKDETMSDEEYAEKMLTDLDLNRDGSINEDEFINGILKNETYVNFIRSIKPTLM
jgi:Ca2+-binding EF-hand superfamily protein